VRVLLLPLISKPSSPLLVAVLPVSLLRLPSIKNRVLVTVHDDAISAAALYAEFAQIMLPLPRHLHANMAATDPAVLELHFLAGHHHAVPRGEPRDPEAVYKMVCEIDRDGAHDGQAVGVEEVQEMLLFTTTVLPGPRVSPQLTEWAWGGERWLPKRPKAVKSPVVSHCLAFMTTIPFGCEE
jgi:hypothetical protein